METGEESGAESASEFGISDGAASEKSYGGVSELRRREMETTSQIRSLISQTRFQTISKGIPSGITQSSIFLSLANLEAVVALAISTSDCGLTCSDLTVMLSNEILPLANSYTCLPESYRIQRGEKRKFSGFMNGLRFVEDSKLRSDALKLAAFVRLSTINRLKLSRRRLFKEILARYVEDLCLPTTLTDYIMSVFKRGRLMSIDCDVPDYYPWDSIWLKLALPNVSARVLALILVALKLQFGLDDVREYSLSFPAGDFDIVAWIRLSKLRLDHLIANDSMAREQYRTFKNNGTPSASLQSMEETREIFENVCVFRHSESPKKFVPVGLLKSYVEEISPPAKVTSKPVESAKYLQEKTVALQQTTDCHQLVNHMERLLSMTNSHFINQHTRCRSHRLKTKCPDQIRTMKELRINKRKHYTHSKVVESFTVIDSGVDRDCIGQETGDVCGGYWIASHWREQNANGVYKLKIPHKVGGSLEETYLRHFQFLLPDNYTWILRYFAAYALIRVEVLEEEVMNVEQCLLEKNFFFENTAKMNIQQDSKYNLITSAGVQVECYCTRCLELNGYFAKDTERVT